MSAYLIADVTVTNPQQYEEYKRWSSKAMAEFDAQVLVRGGATQVMEGDWTPGRVVVLGFQSMDHARRFYDSQTYGHARQARAGAAIMRMILVEGAA